MTSAAVSKRLRAACIGHPHAEIEWPHRVLHEGADTIDELEAWILKLVDEFEDATYDRTDGGQSADRKRLCVEARAFVKKHAEADQ